MRHWIAIVAAALLAATADSAQAAEPIVVGGVGLAFTSPFAGTSKRLGERTAVRAHVYVEVAGFGNRSVTDSPIVVYPAPVVGTELAVTSSRGDGATVDWLGRGGMSLQTLLNISTFKLVEPRAFLGVSVRKARTVPVWGGGLRLSYLDLRVLRRSEGLSPFPELETVSGLEAGLLPVYILYAL